MFFGENSSVAPRSIRRYIGLCASKLGNLSDQGQIKELEVQKNSSQMIESCIKLWKGWKDKGNTDKAVVAFDQGWSSLLTFVQSDPIVDLGFLVIWELMLKVRTHTPMKLAEELTTSALSRRPVCAGDHAGRQAKYAGMMAANLLIKSNAATQAVAEHIGEGLATFYDVEGADGALVQSMKCFLCVVPPL